MPANIHEPYVHGNIQQLEETLKTLQDLKAKTGNPDYDYQIAHIRERITTLHRHNDDKDRPNRRTRRHGRRT